MPITPAQFDVLYPIISRWIEETLAMHATSAKRVDELGFRGLPLCYSPETLRTAHVVQVAKLPVPPLSSWGLTQFVEWERGTYTGITYDNTFFVIPASDEDESLHFHELVHVVQWRVLGRKNFVAAYADGLERFGYYDSPLEKMAYGLEARFKRGEHFDAEREIVSAL